MRFELVSFRLCPFVQRAVIALRYKDVPFHIRYVDLSDPPKWFQRLSPAGKVPLLLVDDEHVIFESAVINELIDEVVPPRLHPADPIERAQNRAWIEYGSTCLMDTLRMSTAEDEDRFREAVAASHARLVRLESEFGEGPFFNGEPFSLVDAAYAPLFMRLQLLGRYAPVFDAEALPGLSAWSDQLLALAAVRESVVEDFDMLFARMIAGRGGYLATLLPR